MWPAPSSLRSSELSILLGQLFFVGHIFFVGQLFFARPASSSVFLRLMNEPKMVSKLIGGYGRAVPLGLLTRKAKEDPVGRPKIGGFERRKTMTEESS
jgi:hypothetical protein